ncbi:hypothetical protein M2H13_23290 [Vibrio vulnificus]|nr:hypothetical protein [Vibrio vulnificus]MCU8164051.1 hypothetical protein [Vibrio vulnificus]MCU8181809.1 hypothetical protein [Vibrio vulnificus]MCU8357009.1 hypothetical protein [Vibrio vulnificus]MCU8479000.1 hypothetical protein [Vibrio vulnificus]
MVCGSLVYAAFTP